MSRQVIGSIVFVTLFAFSHALQAEIRQETPAPAERPASGQNKPFSETPPAAPQGQPINVKLDLTITDQAGPETPAKKIVSLIVADRMSGSVRSVGNSLTNGSRAIINVDATPQLLSNGSIRVMLGLEYNPRLGNPTVETNASGSSLNQRVTVILQPNQPLVFSQAADPLSDRKISVEVRATILK